MANNHPAAAIVSVLTGSDARRWWELALICRWRRLAIKAEVAMTGHRR